MCLTEVLQVCDCEQRCTSKMLDVTKSIHIDDCLKNIDFSKCCNTESLLLTKLWNDDTDIMGLLQQRVSSWVLKMPSGTLAISLTRL